MTPSAAMRLATAALLAGVLACALTGSGGCDRQDGQAPPLAGTGVVRGRVGGVTGAASVRVEFSSTEPGPGEREFSVTADSSGRYEVELPAGDYRVSAVSSWARYFHTATDPDPREDRADTLRLRAGDPPHTIDLPLGLLRIVATVPTSLDNHNFQFLVQSQWPTESMPSAVRSGNALVADGNLELVLPFMRPGDYSVRASWDLDGRHHGDEFWLPDAATMEQAARHRVGADSTCTVTMELASEPAHVSGSVTGAWQALSLSPPRVRAMSPEGELLAGDWEVDDDGGFALDLYLPRPFRLTIRTGSTVQWIGGSGPDDATIFRPEPGQSITDLDLVSSGLRLRVTTDDQFGEFHSVHFELCDPGSLSPVFSWYSSLSAQMGVAGLPVGTWLLHVSHPYYYSSATWRSQWFDRAAGPASAAPIVVPAGGGVAVLELVLERGGAIIGTATSAAGDSSYVQALLTSADHCAVLDKYYFYLYRGVFHFGGLDDGLYRVGIAPGDGDWVGEGMPPPPDTVWYPGTTDWAAATDIAIVAADTVRGLSITVT